MKNKESDFFTKCVEDSKQCAEESLSMHLEGVANALQHLLALNAVLVDIKRKRKK